MPEERKLYSESLIIGCGYETGFYSKQQVIRWADEWIDRLEEPPVDLIELSMDKGVDSFIDFLPFTNLGYDNNSNDAVELGFGFVGLMRTQMGLSLSSSISKLWDLSYWSEEADHLRHKVTVLDVQYEIYMDGFGKPEEISKEIDQCLAPYVELLSIKLQQLAPFLRESTPHI